MWCDIQSPAMMGLQATASKRKLEYDSQSQQPAKLARLEPELEEWRLCPQASAVPVALPGGEGDDEDEGGDAGGREYPRYGAYPHYQARPQYWGAAAASADYYAQSAQQTIRCDENGKSYLDLGSSSARYAPPPPPPAPAPPAASAAPAPAKEAADCCSDGAGWCGRGPDAACYRQRRLAVLNVSMCKLSRYRQFPDPSLRRSVLICNTLRYIEREMEQEGCFFGGHGAPPPTPAAPQPAEPEPSYAAPPAFAAPAPGPYGGAPAYRAAPGDAPPPSLYEQNLRDLSASGRATPFPAPCPDYDADADADSGLGDEESARGINWGSVLSLSSQSDLDPLNNNELYSPAPTPPPPHSPADSGGSLSLLGDVDLGHEFDDFLPSWKLTPLSADDILKSVPSSEFSARQGEGELDSIMHVLVGS